MSGRLEERRLHRKARPEAAPARAPGASPPAEMLLRLQRTVGNHAVAQLFRRRRPAPAGSVLQRAKITSTTGGDIDTLKLTDADIRARIDELEAGGGAADEVSELRGALARWEFAFEGTLRQFVALLKKRTPEAKLTEGILHELDSISDAIGGETVRSIFDAEKRLTFPLAPRVTRSQWLSVQWCLGHLKRHPGAGTLGDLRIAGDTVVGRPNFPHHTQKHFGDANPTDAKRHIVAWHTIRALTNGLIAECGSVKAAVAALSDITIAVPADVASEADRLIKKAPAKIFGSDADSGKQLVRLLYYMNGNPANLWLGNSRINSGLPQLFNTVRDEINGAGTWRQLVRLAISWLGEDWKNVAGADKVPAADHAAAKPPASSAGASASMGKGKGKTTSKAGSAGAGTAVNTARYVAAYTIVAWYKSAALRSEVTTPPTPAPPATPEKIPTTPQHAAATPLGTPATPPRTPATPPRTPTTPPRTPTTPTGTGGKKSPQHGFANDERLREYLVSKGLQAIKSLEVDYQPGSKAEQKNLEDVEKQVVISYGLQIEGHRFDRQLVHGLFERLLTYGTG